MTSHSHDEVWSVHHERLRRLRRARRWAEDRPVRRPPVRRVH